MTDEDFQKRLKEQNQTSEALREEVRRNLAIQNCVTSSALNSPSKMMKSLPSTTRTSSNSLTRAASAASIVVDPADNGGTNDAKSEADATAKINNIYQRLKSGADFATVAREQSEDPTGQRGGDLGFATEDALKQSGMPPELINQFFGAMKVGDITAPVKFPSGLHYIFKLQQNSCRTRI
jgi:hypothetical protein